MKYNPSQEIQGEPEKEHPVDTTRAIPSYTSPDAEYDAAINRAALTDRSHFGRIEITGADRVDLLHRLSTNDLLRGRPGSVIGTVFTTEKGRVVDYVTLLLKSSSLLAITSPTNEQKFTAWIDKYCIMEDVRLTTVTASTSMFSFIGPESKSIIKLLFDLSLDSQSTIDITNPLGPISIAYSKDFGTDIFDLIVSETSADLVWQELSRESEKHGIPRMGRAAYDAFRITRGIPALGAEISESFNPYEVGLHRAISFTKGCYIGQEVIARLDTYERVQRELVGLIFHDPSLGIQAGATLSRDSKDIGLLTSVSETAIHKCHVGLGVVRKDSVVAGDKVQVGTSQETVEAMVATPPFDIC